MNITGVEAKQVSIYVIMTVVYTVAALVFMFYYWKKSLEWRYRKHSHDEKFLDHDLALHSLMVTGLPSEVNVNAMSSKLRLVFEKIFPE